MESTTTDVCEWCKKPMLPPGASVTSTQKPQAAQPPVATAVEQEPEQESLAQEPLQAAEPAQAAAAPPADAAATTESSDDDVLRPLGHGEAAKPTHEPGAPSHGLADSATQTSINLEDYMGAGGSIFRPIERPVESATSEGMDPLARRHRGPAKQQTVNEVPDNTRMLRSLVTGLVISLPLAVVQFVVGHPIPEKLYFLPLGDSDSFVTALGWGVASGILLGGGLGALLVQFKKGPFVGLLCGIMLGMWGLNNPPFWGLIAGALTGIVVGRHATVGYRRAMTV